MFNGMQGVHKAMFNSTLCQMYDQTSICCIYISEIRILRHNVSPFQLKYMNANFKNIVKIVIDVI